MRNSVLLAAAFAGCLLASPAAATVTINFENIATYGINSGIAVQNFYNGGTASNGASGTNLGVSFASNAVTLCLNTLGTTCSVASRGGLGDPTSAFTAMFLAPGGPTTTSLTDATGFTSGISFFYVSPVDPGSVQIFDGLNGTGNLLASSALAINGSACSAGAPFNAGQYCPFSQFSLPFNGTGKSIVFGGTPGTIVFDDITLGVGLPEPATWAMMLLGFGVLGMSLRASRRRRTAALA
jgi:hypothetical protein